MASTSEKGHAKNIANANLLNTHIIELGAIYNPSNPKTTFGKLTNHLHQFIFSTRKC